MRNPGAKDVLISEILVIFAIVLVAARLNLRLRVQKRRLLQSDKWMVVACVSGVLTAGFVPVFAYLNAFDPKVHTTLEGYSGGTEDLTVILKLLFAINFPFYTTLYLCKAALLAVYQQAFPDFMVKRRMFLWMTIWYVALSYVTTVLVAFCVCMPIERHWHLGLSTTCSLGTYVITFNVGWGLSFVGDLLVFILPWLIVPGLRVKRSLRLGIYFTFLLGSVNMAVSLVRFVMIFQAAADSTISLSTIILWSALDVNIGLVIACLPSLRPYFGSRSKSEENSHNIEAGPSGKSWRYGERALHRHGMQHGEEGLPTSFSVERSRDLSVDCTIVVPWDEGKGHEADARNIEMVHNGPPKEVTILAEILKSRTVGGNNIPTFVPCTNHFLSTSHLFEIPLAFCHIIKAFTQIPSFFLRTSKSFVSQISPKPQHVLAMPGRNNMNTQHQISIPAGHDISARLEAMNIRRDGGVSSENASEARRAPHAIVASSAGTQAAQQPDYEYDADDDEGEAKGDAKSNLLEHQASDEATLLSQLPNDPPEIFKIRTHMYNDSGRELNESQIRNHRRFRAMKRDKAAKKVRVAEEERQRHYKALNADHGCDDEEDAKKRSKNPEKGKKPFDINRYVPYHMKERFEQ
ncbi:hypothetical protein FGRMN_6603 [Fusarium graminum]|nr:hypothetical protein FGRMN_6603 [Fusarium graminum]